MKALSKSLWVASLAGVTFLEVGLGQTAQAATFDIFSEISPGVFGSDPIATVNGFVDPTKTLRQFYGYSNFSFDNPTINPQLRKDTTHFFIVEAKDGIGLGFVHDEKTLDPTDTTGGLVKMQFEVKAPTASFKQVDDLVDDPFSITNSAPPTNDTVLFTLLNGWGPTFTDGGMIGALDEVSPDWSVKAKFIPIVNSAGNTVASTGISRWVFLTPGGGFVNLSPNSNPLLPANLGRQILIKPTAPLPAPAIPLGIVPLTTAAVPLGIVPPTTAAVPEPSSLGGLVFLGLLGGGFMVRRARLGQN